MSTTQLNTLLFALKTQLILMPNHSTVIIPSEVSVHQSWSRHDTIKPRPNYLSSDVLVSKSFEYISSHFYCGI